MLLVRQELQIMESRVAVISIIVTDANRVDSLNELLHEYSEYILVGEVRIWRM